MQVHISQAKNMITTCVKAGLVAMMMGSPGIGKSAAVYQFAAEHSLKVIDMRLSQCDPTDLMGMPSVKDGRSGYFPMNTFPIEGDAIPEGYNGWVLFLDEMTSAARAVQAAAYKLVLDRMVGIYALHKNVAIICAGNMDTDNAIVEPMSTALQSRLVHFELVVSTHDFLEWAYVSDVNHYITDYIKFKPTMLYTFRADHTDNTYACPRTWEFANRILKIKELDSPDMLPLLSGTLSEGVAREFLTSCKIYEDLPTPEQIKKSPATIKVPEEPSILYALTGSLADNARWDDFESTMKYVSRLPAEFQIITLRETVKRNTKMTAHPALQNWLANSAVTLI